MSLGVEQRLAFFPRRFDRVYFVSEEIGSDSNDGLSEFSTFATLNKAITTANAQTPAFGDPVLIRILDSQTYNPGMGDVTIAGFVNIYAPEAELTGNGTTPSVLKGSFNQITFGSINGTDLTIQQTSGTGFGAMQVTAPSIYNADGLFELLTANGASGDELLIFSQSINAIGPLITGDTGEFYVSSQNIDTLVDDALDVASISMSGGKAYIVSNDIDGSNSGAGDLIGVRALAGGEVFVTTNCNTTDVAYAADGAGSKVQATGAIENTISETTSGIVNHIGTDGSSNAIIDAGGNIMLKMAAQQMVISSLASTITIAPDVSGTTFQTSLANTRTTFNVQGNGAMNARLQLAYGNIAQAYSRWEQASTNLQLLFGTNIASYIVNGDRQDVDTIIRGDNDLNLIYANAGTDNVGIGQSPNASAKLEVVSTTGGFVAPVMTAAQASAITPISGLMLYVTDTNATFTNVGYWAYEAGAWNDMTTGSGAASLNVVSKVFADSPYTTADGEAILYDASGGNSTVNLPAASANAQITIKKTDATANTVTIDGNGAETIDGGLTAVLTTQYESITLISDGSNWFII